MIMENQPFEDASPIKNGDFPASHVSFLGSTSGILFKKTPEEWWLGDSFPIGSKGNFLGPFAVKLRGCIS